LTLGQNFSQSTHDFLPWISGIKRIFCFDILTAVSAKFYAKYTMFFCHGLNGLNGFYLAKKNGEFAERGEFFI
jgi:hypothetical protein